MSISLVCLLLVRLTTGADEVDDAVVEVELTLEVRVRFGDRAEHGAAGAGFHLALVAPLDGVFEDLVELVGLQIGDADLLVEGRLERAELVLVVEILRRKRRFLGMPSLRIELT